MKSVYDPKSDTLVIELRPGPVAESDEDKPGIILDYDAEGNLVVGSRLAQNNVSFYKIAILTGNSPENCRRHYAALVPEAMAGEVEFRTNDQPNAVAGPLASA